MRDTAQIFDLTIKYLLYGVSPALITALINALFDRRYKASSAVQFRKTETVKNQGAVLEQYRADMIVSIEDDDCLDDYAVEFQIGNDELIGLRIFEYGLQYAYETKELKDHGASIDVFLPESCVVYWESTPSTPELITLRFKSRIKGSLFEYEVRVLKMADQELASLEEQNLLVLLPFCLLKFRKALKQAGEDPEARQALAQAELKMIDGLEGILKRGQERRLLSAGDGIIILESISQMHRQLYQDYSEFQRAGTVLDDQLILRWKSKEQELIAHEQEAVKQAVEQTAKQERTRILNLFRQGHTADEVERILDQEKGIPQ